MAFYRSVTKNRQAWAADLARPAPLGALALLVANDHLWKGSGVLPAIVTGKLSDVAGLFLAGVLAVALLRGAALALGRRDPGRRGIAAGITLASIGAGFTALKLHPGTNRVIEIVWGANAMDPTDLLALPALGLAWRWLGARERGAAGPEPRRAAGAAALCAALLACAATSAPAPVPPRPVPGWVLSNGAPRLAGCAQLDAWIAKTGKTGVGLTIRALNRSSAPCDVAVVSGVMRVGALAVVALPPPAGGRARCDCTRVVSSPASADDPCPPADDDRGACPRDPAPAPLPPAQADYVYLPFEVDDQSLWNRGLRQGRFEVKLLIEGKAVTFAADGEQRMVQLGIGS